MEFLNSLKTIPIFSFHLKCVSWTIRKLNNHVQDLIFFNSLFIQTKHCITIYIYLLKKVKTLNTLDRIDNLLLRIFIEILDKIRSVCYSNELNLVESTIHVAGSIWIEYRMRAFKCTLSNLYIMWYKTVQISKCYLNLT